MTTHTTRLCLACRRPLSIVRKRPSWNRRDAVCSSTCWERMNAERVKAAILSKNQRGSSDDVRSVGVSRGSVTGLGSSSSTKVSGRPAGRPPTATGGAAAGRIFGDKP